MYILQGLSPGNAMPSNIHCTWCNDKFYRAFLAPLALRAFLAPLALQKNHCKSSQQNYPLQFYQAFFALHEPCTEKAEEN
jgi:hypothetical protein